MELATSNSQILYWSSWRNASWNHVIFAIHKIYSIYKYWNQRSTIYLLNIIKDDTNTITGRNIHEILNSTNENNIFNLKLSKIRKHKFCELPENEKWRINFIKELTNVKLKNLEINFTNNEEFTRKEIDAIIEIISTM